MAHKICVYAICKNEKKYIEKWLLSMSEADYIAVLDTGSTDGTYEILQQDPRVTVVAQEIIEPWRFDVARNESMNLVPDDADILVCTDFDEVFTPHWADVIRENWDDETERAFYHYAWSHGENGEPADCFWYDKIHTRNFHWYYPVHEVLLPNDPNSKFKSIKLDDDRIWLHHYPDPEKPRGYYLNLLELSMQENPDDPHTVMLYARELIFCNKKKESLEMYKKALSMPEIEKKSQKLVKLECIGRVGDLSVNFGDFKTAEEYYEKWIEIDRTYREPYFCLGEMFINRGLYTLAEGVIRMGLKMGVRKYDWVERHNTWLAEGEYLLSVACFYNDNIDDAIKYSTIAIDHNINDAHMLQNHISYLMVKNAQLQAQIDGEEFDPTLGGTLKATE